MTKVSNLIKERILYKYISIIIIPLILLFFWASLSILFNSYSATPLSVLAYSADPYKDTIPVHKSEIRKGAQIKGVFTAKDNNLGIVLVRFNTFSRINNDILLFSIKEKGQKHIYYENFYKVNQFQPEELFTFGFPLIINSKDKIYEFSLTSTKGKKGDAVAISMIDPVVVTKYQFTQSELLSNRYLFVSHFWKKFIFSFTNMDFFISSLVYLLPFVIYSLWYSPVKSFLIFFSTRYLKLKYMIQFNWVVIYILGLIVVNILFVRQLSNDVGTLILIVSWIIISRRYSLDSSVTFLFTIFFLLLIPLFSIFNLLDIAERSAVWFFYFMVLGILQQYFFDNNKKILKRKQFNFIFQLLGYLGRK